MDILYQDNHLVLCTKPAGVLSESGGMPEMLEAALGGRFFCVHRLDRAVGGLMVYARDEKAAAKLSALVSERKLDKEYLAIISGSPEEIEGSMRDLLFKDSAKNKSYVVKRMRKGVKEALLEYRVLEKLGDRSLIKIKLITGRSHQIRVQFSSRGMPLLGDVKYGSTFKEYPLALWSHSLAFRHPFTGKSVEMSALPPAEAPWKDFHI